MNTDRATELLIDAMVMLRDIKKARQLPAFGQLQNQYIKLGDEIDDFLRDEGVMVCGSSNPR